jgi:hypothetical protein
MQRATTHRFLGPQVLPRNRLTASPLRRRVKDGNRTMTLASSIATFDNSAAIGWVEIAIIITG